MNNFNISVESLKSEEKLDQTINLSKFLKYVYVSYNDIENNWTVYFVENGIFTYKKICSSQFEAKLVAVNYLKDIGLINISNNILDTIQDGDKNNEFNQNEPSLPKSKICPVCNKEFVIKNKFATSMKYCDDCKSKYSPYELKALDMINGGKVTQNTSNKINKLLKEGKTKTYIANSLKLGNTSMVDPILKFLPPNEVNQIDYNYYSVCQVCGEKFKSNSKGTKYCENCKSKYSGAELIALAGINQRIYTKRMAYQINKFLKEGKSNLWIAKKFNIKNTTAIPHIVKFLIEDSK